MTLGTKYPEDKRGDGEFVRLNCNVEKNWHREIKMAAVAHDVTMSEVVRMAIDEFMINRGWLTCSGAQDAPRRAT